MTVPEAKLAKPPTNSNRRKPHTLVIDDDIVVADTLAMVLKTGGFETTTVYSGKTGVELARSREFDYLVTSAVMPHMNGIEAAIEICKILPECKVLLVSGDNEAGALLQEAETRGYKFDLLAMPVHPFVLFQTLRSVGAAQCGPALA
jgi:CheY-like chemotaxis protein